jgi:hypothetical protein
MVDDPGLLTNCLRKHEAQHVLLPLRTSNSGASVDSHLVAKAPASRWATPNWAASTDTRPNLALGAAGSVEPDLEQLAAWSSQVKCAC